MECGRGKNFEGDRGYCRHYLPRTEYCQTTYLSSVDSSTATKYVTRTHSNKHNDARA